MYNSSLIAILPPSQKWVIWADRNYKLMILGVNSDEIDINSNRLYEEWISSEDIHKIGDWISFVFDNEAQIKEFTHQLYFCYK